MKVSASADHLFPISHINCAWKTNRSVTLFTTFALVTVVHKAFTQHTVLVHKWPRQPCRKSSAKLEQHINALAMHSEPLPFQRRRGVTEFARMPEEDVFRACMVDRSTMRFATQNSRILAEEPGSCWSGGPATSRQRCQTWCRERPESTQDRVAVAVSQCEDR